jgi:hypothetical protein
MRGLAIVAAASVLAFSATMATAGVIHKRQKRQRARIHQGVRSGEITSDEAAKLHAEEQAIQADREKALADGKLTKRERRSIRHEQNQAGRDVRHEKHNRPYTP